MATVTEHFTLVEAIETAEEYLCVDDLLLARLIANGRKNVEKGKIEGGVLTFTVADGLAYYLVLNDTDPLELAWLAVGDHYYLADWQLKGLDAKLALELLTADATINKVFVEGEL